MDEKRGIGRIPSPPFQYLLGPGTKRLGRKIINPSGGDPADIHRMSEW